MTKSRAPGAVNSTALIICVAEGDEGLLSGADVEHIIDRLLLYSRGTPLINQC